MTLQKAGTQAPRDSKGTRSAFPIELEKSSRDRSRSKWATYARRVVTALLELMTSAARDSKPDFGADDDRRHACESAGAQLFGERKRRRYRDT